MSKETFADRLKLAMDQQKVKQVDLLRMAEAVCELEDRPPGGSSPLFGGSPSGGGGLAEGGGDGKIWGGARRDVLCRSAGADRRGRQSPRRRAEEPEE